MITLVCIVFFFFFNDTATTEIYPLSLHDALPIFPDLQPGDRAAFFTDVVAFGDTLAVNEVERRPLVALEASMAAAMEASRRSEEHTSELQSRLHLVCRLLLEKNKNNRRVTHRHKT